MKSRLITIFLTVLLLASCASDQTGKRNKTSSYQAIGHDLEAVIRKDAKGSPLALLVQQQMDRYDREQLNHVFERGLSGQTSSWTNPDRGNQYRITPLPARQTIGKSVCRKATIEAMLRGDDGLGSINIKACRANNKQWQLSEEK